ncbi:MAG: hypothetical protein ACF8MJ_09540 [Phycisphaerales bacterium JB050]
MSVPFPLVVSPYELDARGAVADVAFLLGQPAITLLPTPFEGTSRESVNAAAASAPEFARLIRRWGWMQDLWRNGALRPSYAGIEPIDLVRETEHTIRNEPGFAGLSNLMRQGVFDSTHEYLRALCRDIPLGGAEPAVSVPISVGLSRFAHAINAPLLQEHTRRSNGSIVRRLETRALRTTTRISIPLPRDVEPEVTLELRDILAAPLERLRGLLESDQDTSGDDVIDFEQTMLDAMQRETIRFGLSSAPRRGRRLSMVLLSCATMPEQAPLVAALRASSLASRRRNGVQSVSGPASSTLALRPLRVLSVRELPWQEPV